MTFQKRLRDLSELSGILPGPENQGKAHHRGKGDTLHMRIEKSGRKGKIVTVITGFQHNPQTMEKIAKELKQFCGAGGTVKGMVIEIQGDQRARLQDKLTSMDYNVK